MKIVVLAGGLSTERLVALTSGTGVCRALRERGHKAILVDMFLGLENYEGVWRTSSTRRTACARITAWRVRRPTSRPCAEAAKTRARPCSARTF